MALYLAMGAAAEPAPPVTVYANYNCRTTIVSKGNSTHGNDPQLFVNFSIRNGVATNVTGGGGITYEVAPAIKTITGISPTASATAVSRSPFIHVSYRNEDGELIEDDLVYQEAIDFFISRGEPAEQAKAGVDFLFDFSDLGNK